MAGMPSEQLSCEKCGDTGWVVGNEGGVRQARPCTCRVATLRREKLAAAGIPERYRDCTIDNFNDMKSSDLTAAKRAAREFVDRFPFVDAGLLFVGDSGRGKTHLACAILSELVSTKGTRGLYADSSALLNRIQSSFRADSDSSRESVLAPCMSAELLVLDEIGATPPHPWVQDVLYDLLNTRYNGRKITIATTNYADDPPASAGTRVNLEDRVGYRTRSRLYEMCLMVTLRGEDYRKVVLSPQVRSRF
jgi:DNA replication protein DnaC